MFSRISLIFLLALFLINCEKEGTNFRLDGTINGLKKGTVYLQQYKDSSLVTIDSVVVKGEPNFNIEYELEEPEVLFLRLNKNDADEGVVSFFADTGVTRFNSSLKNFIYDAKIEGSRQQKLMEEYMVMISKFNDTNLDLIKRSLETASTDSTASEKIDADFKNLLRRKYLYTINFAYNHKDSEVSPYLAVSQIPDANPRYLDTIYAALSDNIKSSKYGVELKELIESKKKQL